VRALPILPEDGFRPGRLWSLWDMLEKYGLHFTASTVALSEAKWLCIMVSENPTLSTKLTRERVIKTLGHGLQLIKTACILSDMIDVLPELDRLWNLVLPESSDAPLAPLSGLAQAVNHLVSRIQDSLRSEFFFHLNQGDVQFYVLTHPFGQPVSERFPKAIEDISEAGKCLALQRPTACVFHLMRVLELGVQSLGKKLKVAIDVQNETWHQIILHVNNKIIGLPSKTAKQKQKKSAMAEAASHLQSVRLAWRNEVMHPKQTYTRDEAFDLFNASRIFMNSLAMVL
jgi:hypothetical protein